MPKATDTHTTSARRAALGIAIIATLASPAIAAEASPDTICDRLVQIEAETEALCAHRTGTAAPAMTAEDLFATPPRTTAGGGTWRTVVVQKP